MKAGVRTVIGLVVLIVCCVALYKVMRKRSFIPKVEKIHEQYDATGSDVKKIEACKKAYQDLLDQAPSAKERKIVEGGMAACDASIAYLNTLSKPGIPQYSDAIQLMDKAKELTGDKEGIWAQRIKTFKKRLQDSIGPTGPEIDAQFAQLKKRPFKKAMRGIENLYFWGFAWKQQKRFQDDKPRQAALEKMRVYLRDQYTALFEQSVADARNAGVTPAFVKALSPDKMLDKAAQDKVDRVTAPLGWMANVKRLDKGRAAQLASKYARDLALAQKVAKAIEPKM